MDYFLLKQDERYTNTPRLRDIFYKANVRNINRENSHKIDDVVIFQVDAEDGCEYTDISEKLIKVFFRYDTEMIIKTLPLIDAKRNRQENYYLPILEDVEALNEKTELGFNKTVYKKIVLDKEKIKDKKIFRIKESSKNLVVVRLDVAESILRRKPKGICLERLEVQ